MAGFSIVVPTHGRPQPLTRCLEGLSRLDFPRDRFEVVVVDDGSRENQEPVVAPWQSRLNLKLVRQLNAGPAAARNHGARRAAFPFLAFIDDDCVPDPRWLHAFEAAFADTPDALVGGKTVNALPENPYSSASQHLVSYLCGYFDGQDGRTRLFTSNNMAVRAEAFRAAGQFDTGFPRAAGEDREFCDRWVAQGGGTRFVEDARVLHAHSLTLRDYWRQHFEYGRGAALFGQSRAMREGAAVRVEPLAFYVNLLRFPFAGESVPLPVRTSMLLALSQVANAAGYLSSALRKRESRPRADQRPTA